MNALELVILLSLVMAAGVLLLLQKVVQWLHRLAWRQRTLRLGANLSRANLTGATLERADLSGADLTGATGLDAEG